MTHHKVLAYSYIAVTFQLRSSINVRLTESSLYNMVCTKMFPKMGFGGDFGVGTKTFGEKVHPFLELRVFRHLWSRSDAPCNRILYGYTAICHRRNFGQVWGSPAPLPEVAGKLRCLKAPL